MNSSISKNTNNRVPGADSGAHAGAPLPEIHVGADRCICPSSGAHADSGAYADAPLQEIRVGADRCICPSNKPAIGHFSRTFFVKSETFIHHYLTHMKTVTPVCVSWNIENADLFPFPAENMHALQLKPYSLQWFYYGTLKRLLHRDVYFRRIVEKQHLALLHAHFGHNGVQALELKRGLKHDIPLVTTFYGADLSRRDIVEPMREDYLRLFQEGDLFLVEGPFMKTALQHIGCPAEKIEIQRIAVPVDRIAYRERKPDIRRPVQLVFCGRFIEKKGLIYALEAVRKLWIERKNRNFRFCIIGDGILKKDIVDFIDKHAMHDVVELPGFLTYDAYLNRLEQADVFIHPSVTAADGDSEGGAPTSILEAQAMGLPIISTVHADIPHITVPGKSALLSPERDADALAENILTLLENRDMGIEMGKAGRAFVETFHDVKKEVTKLEEKYLRLLHHGGSACL